MNNKNKVLVGCLALLLVLSVGYALFSDTITINGTATAKGSFDITATCETGISNKLGTVESLGLYAEGGYENDTCSVTDDTVSFNTGFLYPGARRYFTVKFTNTGTIDATRNLTSGEKTEQICVADNLKGENKECDNDNDLKGYFANIFSEIANSGKGYAMEDSEGNILTQAEINEFYDSETYIVTLKPGYSLYLVYNSIVNHTEAGGAIPSNEMFVEFTATMTNPFTQAQ